MTIAKINKKVSKDYVKLLIDFDGADGATTHTATTGQTVTFAGTAQLDTAQKKFGDSSLLLDGNSDYVTIPDSDDWSFGTGDFTIDCYVRFNDLTNSASLVGQQADGNNYWIFSKGTNALGNKLAITFKTGTVFIARYIMTNSWSGCATNTWYHLAVVRNGTSCLIFIDGVVQTLTETTAVGTNDVGNVASVLYIGQLFSDYYLNGWLDELRVSKGIARWTENFNVSDVAPGLIDIAKINKKVSKDYVKLLIQFDGADGANTYTAETGQTVTFAGTAQLDTAQKKFGTASLLLDGDSDYVTVPDSDDWAFGTGDFTIDCWARFANITNNFNVLLAQQVDSSNYWRFFKYNDNAIRFTVSSGGVAVANYRTDASIISAINTWYHLAVVRSGTNIYLFVDGIQNTTELTAVGSNSLPNFAEVLSIGRSGVGGLYHEGYIDHLRISKGVARWTENFNVSDVAPGLIDIAKVNNIAI